MSDAVPPDPAPPDKPPYPPSPLALRAMALTLPRPPADAPATAWQDALRDGLDSLGSLDPHDPIEAMLAIQIIGANAGALDALRLAFEPTATAAQALRQRNNAAALTRAITGAMRLLKQQRRQPAPEPRDWGNAVAEVAAAWRQEPARPVEAPRAATAEPEEIVRWIDEIDDAELAEAVEADRREQAGEPPLPRQPGPKVVYKYKPEDYIHRWVPDERAKQKYPGWENMTKPERRAFFGYTYDGPVAPLEMLTPASRAAAEAGEE
jgi:hypothetical protein